MANKVFDYYKELPSWAKGVVVVGGLGITYFAVRAFLNRVKAQAQQKKDNATVIQQQNEAKALEQTGMKPSYPDSQYKAWGDAIQKQFDGCDFSFGNFVLPNIFASYSGYKVYQILDKLKNNLDFLKLSSAYGVRTYDQCGWGTGNFTGSLASAISDELTESEVTELNKLLAKKGITYRF
jgi:hypothetical protein